MSENTKRVKLNRILIFAFLIMTASYLFYNPVSIEMGSLLEGLGGLISAFIDFIIELLGRLF